MTGTHLPIVDRGSERGIDGTDTASVDLAPDVDHGDACITCGDVAVPLTVVATDGADATCRAADGGEEVVATDLVGDVAPGDRLLVHARVAIERLTAAGD